jgi:hypothetical protein
MSAVCRVCGVAVVPGYVRCPKCHAPLPRGAQNPRGGTGTTIDPDGGGGGTSLPSARRFPILPVAIGGVVLLVAIIWFYTAMQDYRNVGRRPAAKQGSDVTDPTAIAGEPTPAPSIAQPDPSLGTTPSPNAPSPSVAASELESGLRRQRLWSTVEVVGDQIDVRSGSCGDPGMAPAVDAARTGLRSAGLTRLRCLEQSGRVVFERDL